MSRPTATSLLASLCSLRFGLLTAALFTAALAPRASAANSLGTGFETTNSSPAQATVHQYVDPFIGTEGHGNVVVGPSCPHGMITSVSVEIT